MSVGIGCKVAWLSVSRMVIHMVILRVGGGGTPYDYHMVKINHMVKIWKISSKNPNHHLLNLHLQLLKSNLCPAASPQHPADVCKPGSSVATSKVCVCVRVRMRCVQ